MLSFVAAVLLLLSTPGPGVLSTAGVGAAFGYRSGLRYVTGLGLGSNITMLAVVTGLAALVLANPVIRMVLLGASTLYLLYLAAKIALAGSKVAFIQADKKPGIMSGLMLQLINPKAYVVATTLFSGFPLFPDAFWLEIIVKFLILNAIWIPIHLIWLYAGASLERLNLPQKTQRGINIIMACAMIGVVLLAALSAR